MEATAKRAAIAAAIDLGTNSFRLLIARRDRHRFIPLVRTTETVRLGENMQRTGNFGPGPMAAGLTVLDSFHRTLAAHKPATVRACATEAFRRAANSGAYLQQASKTLGVAIEVISGEEEATLALAGCLTAHPARHGAPLLLADVGGGSTELILATPTNGDEDGIPPQDISLHPDLLYSLPIGAVSLTEKFSPKTPCRVTDLRAMAAVIRQALAPAIKEIKGQKETVPQLIGSGGTATSLAAMHLKMTQYDPEKIQGVCLASPTLTGQLTKLCGLRTDERAFLPGLAKGRGDIIIAGCLVYQILLELLEIPALTVSDAGLLEGILLSSLKADIS